MKIIHVSEIDIKTKKNLGVLNKTIEQLKAFSKNNYKVSLLLYEDNYPVIYEFEGNDLKKTFEYKPMPPARRKKRILLLKTLYNLYKNYDVIYTRFFIPDPITLLVYKRINKIKLLEIPTKIKAVKKEIKANQKGLKKIIGLIFLELFSTKLLGMMNLNIVISDNNLDNSSKYYCLNNGLGIENIPLKNVTKQTADQIHLIAVANISNWHGYDRIINGLKLYYKDSPKRQVYFHIVGEGVELPSLKALARKLNIEKYIVFYGVKKGKDLDEIFDKCNIGIGSLSMHKLNLQYASTLKLREYCARGIPFLLGYEDLDFHNFKYALKVPNDDNPIDIEMVISFYDSIKDENYTEEMRSYAEKYLTWETKMKPIIEKISEMGC